MGDERGKSKELAERTKSLPRDVEESNSIGAPAGDATSGVSETPEEWAARQPLEDLPTFPLDAGDPSPMQPAAGSPDLIEGEAEENPRISHRSR
jgi:hypothetical protein